MRLFIFSPLNGLWPSKVEQQRRRRTLEGRWYELSSSFSSTHARAWFVLVVASVHRTQTGGRFWCLCIIVSFGRDCAFICLIYLSRCPGINSSNTNNRSRCETSMWYRGETEMFHNIETCWIVSDWISLNSFPEIKHLFSFIFRQRRKNWFPQFEHCSTTR